MTKNLAVRVLFGYLLFAYALPWVAIIVTSYESPFYKMPPLGPAQIAYGALLFLAVIVAARAHSKAPALSRVTLRAPSFLPYAGFMVALTGTVAMGFLSGMSRWRYENFGLSEGLTPTTLAFVLAPSIFEALLFLEIFFFEARGVQQRAITLLLAFGLALVASGIGPMLLVLLALLYFFFPAQIRLLIFNERNEATTKRVATKIGLIPLAIAGIVLLLILLVLGEQIKTGQQDSTAVTDYYSAVSFGDTVDYLISRFSTALVSLNVALFEFSTLSWAEVSQNLWAPISNFLFRLDLLTGGHFGAVKPYTGSLMRLNYELINYYPTNEREGTSPGLIAGFVIALSMPVSILALYLYVRLLRLTIATLSLGMQGTATLIGSMAVLYFVYGLFQSPIDYLLIFDPAVFSLIFYIGLALFIKRKMRKENRHVSVIQPA